LRTSKIVLRALPLFGVLAATVLATGSAFGIAPAASPRSVHACANGQVLSWLSTGANGFAGGMSYQLQFTNVSAQSCSLSGFPGVSATNFTHHQVGGAASKDGTGRTVVLHAGSTTRALFVVEDTGVYTKSACRPVTATDVRVYAPNQTYADVIPFPLSVCSNAAVVSIRIQSVGT
jgi:hypothetical protein